MDITKLKKTKTIQELMNFGILDIDKPANCTSFDVVNHIRHLLNLPKCGHFGTLDPNVTGVLPICLANACRIQEYFMHRDKIYIGKMKFHKEITRKQLEEAMKKFLGKINQLPPRKSRVKRVVREREVMKFELIKFNEKEKEAEFITEVEAGTYIRKLCSDLGDNLGVGAQMTELRRTKAGLFSDKDKEFTTIEKLQEAVKEYKEGKEEKLRKLIIPAEIIGELLDSIELDKENLQKLYNGSPIFKKMLKTEKDIKIIDSGKPFLIICDNKLVEIAKKTDHFENKEIIAKAEVVLK
jgi:H/ACA ribonucleoprotein complex subunit 4